MEVLLLALVGNASIHFHSKVFVLHPCDTGIDILYVLVSLLDRDKDFNPIHLKEFIQNSSVQVVQVGFIAHQLLPGRVLLVECDLKQVQEEENVLGVALPVEQTEHVAHQVVLPHQIVLALFLVIPEDGCQHQYSLSSPLDVLVSQVPHGSLKNPLEVSSHNDLAVLKGI
jgi:hypothetical protein